MEKVRPANYKNLIGQRFGRLTVICENGRNKNGEVRWYCACDCGGNSIVSTSNLNRGNSRSCGCKANEEKKKRAKQMHSEALEKKARAKRERKLNKFVDRFNSIYQGKYTYLYGYDDVENNIITIQCNPCGSVYDIERKNVLKGKFVCKECGNNQRTYHCEDCGKEFVQRTKQQVLCKECHTKHKAEKKKEKRKINKRLREAKAKGNGKVDYSITLTKLIERDKGICKLCGRKVNETDYTYINDTFIAGNDYPSIDHIKPLSKGGVHQWDNVQLAHRLCNSIKCAKE